jgi:hypothetical protein
MGRIVCGSDCHSELLDPLLSDRTEGFVVAEQSVYFWGKLSQNVNVCGLNCHSVQMGGWTNNQGTGTSGEPCLGAPTLQKKLMES